MVSLSSTLASGSAAWGPQQLKKGWTTHQIVFEIAISIKSLLAGLNETRAIATGVSFRASGLYLVRVGPQNCNL